VFPPIADVSEALIAWLRDQRAAGHVPTLVVDAPLDGLELASHLIASGRFVAAGKLVRDVAERVPGAPKLAATARGADVIVRTERDRGPLGSPIALVSGRALDPHDYAAGFAWPFDAGRAELLAWIEQTRAREVFVTGAAAEAIVAAVTELGLRAHVLGPPRQMTLFEAAR
jgi:hypothetical protein